MSAVGNNLPATLILYYVEYVLHSPRADMFLLLYFATGILFLPMWVLGSKKFGKKPIWLVSMALNTGAFFGVFFLAPEHNFTRSEHILACSEHILARSEHIFLFLLTKKKCYFFVFGARENVFGARENVFGAKYNARRET